MVENKTYRPQMVNIIDFPVEIITAFALNRVVLYTVCFDLLCSVALTLDQNL